MVIYTDITRKIDIHIKGKCRNIFLWPDRQFDHDPLVDTHFGICMD